MAWCAVLNFVYGMATSGIGIGAGRLLFNAVISPAKSTAYTAIFYAWMGITGGMAPLLAGIILSVCAGWNTRIGVFVVDGYTLLFILALVLLSFGWWQYSRVKPDDIYTTRAVLRRFAAKLQPPR
jgi:cyanate permease